MQELRKYAVPPPDSQPVDPEDPAWFESPLKHYVPSWVLYPVSEDTGAACEADWNNNQENYAKTWEDHTEPEHWTNCWTDWAWDEQRFGGKTAETYPEWHDYKTAEGYGDDTAWTGWR